ncbi:site-specific DNA-methyltransferase [Brevibacillus daliensis]|uniref:site-specific DNA-methyltransferase n=1 Tax=Brevibacillus daliensis TaxID=2892995 RepID=UPI001E2EEE17|nr:site-specific DNA-methyltransferase [Brevibacillus daliensis]
MINKYDHLTKEELISILNKRDATRKLGLVWERDELEHEKSLNNDFIAVDFIEHLSLGEENFENLLIEGDNFDALRYLHIAYKNRIKCIYIDPPYNTGNKDFIYNDSFVDKDDAWRHSKWLEYMYRRLTLAKDLLSSDGVIFVSIGEEEFAHLSLLMDQVFVGMKVGTFVWRRRSGANDEKNWFLSSDHEYVLCYANPGFSFAGTQKDWSKANDDGDARGPWVDGPLNQGKDIKLRPESFYPILNPNTDIWYPCDPDSVWRFASKVKSPHKKIRTKFMEDLIEENRISWPENESIVSYNTLDELLDAIKLGTAPHNLRVYERLDTYEQKIINNIPNLEFWVGKNIGTGKPRLKRFITEIKKSDKPLSTWILPSSIKKIDLECIDLEQVDHFQVGYTSEGTTLLSRMIGNKDFPYPKPLSLIKTLINQATDSHSDEIILDFFAGSGTTGHAVLDLNSEDGGNRRFILVSSTEATTKNPNKNVCKDVTFKRLKAAIEGYSWRDARGTHEVEGLFGTFAYMKTKRIPVESIHLNISHEQVWYGLQLFHQVGITPYRTDKEVQRVIINQTEVIYVPNLNQNVINELKLLQNEYYLVIYSWQPGLLQQQVSFKNALIERIPEFLIEQFGGGITK